MAGPLAGVRVLEMGQLIAIPWAMKMMADMGAQVIRLESTLRMESYRGDSLYRNDISGEFWNRGGNFYEQNRNKLGITLDLSKPEGLGLLKELVAISDVFAENFTRGSSETSNWSTMTCVKSSRTSLWCLPPATASPGLGPTSAQPARPPRARRDWPT